MKKIIVVLVCLLTCLISYSAKAECHQVGVGPKTCHYEALCNTDASTVQYGGVVQTTCGAPIKVCESADYVYMCNGKMTKPDQQFDIMQCELTHHIGQPNSKYDCDPSKKAAQEAEAAKIAKSEVEKKTAVATVVAPSLETKIQQCNANYDVDIKTCRMLIGPTSAPYQNCMLAAETTFYQCNR